MAILSFFLKRILMTDPIVDVGKASALAESLISSESQPKSKFVLR